MPQENYDRRFVSWQFEFVVFRGWVAYFGDGRDLFWRWGLEGLEFFVKGILESCGCHFGSKKEWSEARLGRQRSGGQDRYGVVEASPLHVWRVIGRSRQFNATMTRGLCSWASKANRHSVFCHLIRLSSPPVRHPVPFGMCRLALHKALVLTTATALLFHFVLLMKYLPLTQANPLIERPSLHDL